MTNKTWLVTGAAGFLGSHVVEQLLQKKCNVVGVDNFSWGKKSNISSFMSHQSFQLIEADIRDSEKIKKVFKSASPQIVVHLAALHFIPDAIKNPTLAVDINIKGTQSVLDALDKNTTKVCWFASTGDVYKKTDDILIEDETPLEPFNIYGISKHICEQLIAHKSTLSPEIQFVIGRIFNLIGVRETNPHILPEIMLQLKKNPKLLSLGNTWPIRDYVAVNDCAKCIIEMCEKANKPIDIFNVATGHGQSVQDLIHVIEEVMGHQISIETDPLKVRSVERAKLVARNSKIKNFLGFAPSPKMKEILEQLLTESEIL
jgi:UDP-glucose 4-epimerase